MRIPFAARFCVALVLLSGTLAPRVAAARDIGPDAFGYRASDVPFVFEDLSGSGRRVLVRSSDDIISAPIGFPFTFYGVDYTTVSWSTNGLLTFSGTNASPANISLAAEAPTGDFPSIAVLWHDWQFVQPGGDASYWEVRGSVGSRRFMVQWHLAFEHPASPSNVIFQVAIFEGSNDILFSYLDVDTATPGGFGGSATVGIRDTAGQLNGRNLEWSCNARVLGTRQSIRYLAPTDTTPPAVEITSPADGSVVGTADVLVAAHVVDESPCRVVSSPAGIDATLPEGGGDVSGRVPLVEGPNTIVVVGTDASANSAGDSIMVVRDMTPPSIAVLSPAMGAILGETPTAVAVSVLDASATTVIIGSSVIGVPAGGGPAAAMVDLVDGLNRIEVSATDRAGNVGTASVEVVLDRNAPLLTIDSPADGASFGPGESPVAMVVTVNDTSSTQVESAPAGLAASLPAGGGIAVGAIPLIEGPNTVTVTAVDATGRAAATSIVLHLDTTPPVVSLDAPSPGMALRGEVEVVASAADAGSGLARVELTVDGGTLAAFTRPPFAAVLDTALFADGEHLVGVVAMDSEGSSSSASVRVLFDNTPPVVAFSALSDGPAVAGMLPLSLAASDGQSGVALIQVLADGSAPSVDPSRAFDPAVSNVQLEGEEDSTRHADGMLLLTALAVDAAGNETLVRVTVEVDNSPPESVSIRPANGSTVSGEIEIVAEAAELDGGTLELFIDDEPRASSTSSPLSFHLDTTSRPDGRMTIRAVARDPAGNEAMAVSTVTVDNVAIEMRLTPTVLDLKHHKGWQDRRHDRRGLVIAHLHGEGLEQLLPVRKHQVQLRVPGGSPVMATAAVRERPCKWRRDRDRSLEKLHVKFDRDRLVASIRAGIAAGQIDPRAEVEVSLYADGALVATSFIRVVWR